MDQIPVIRVRDCLLVSVQTDLHDTVAQGLLATLTQRTRETGARAVILDVSGVDIIDSYITRVLSDIGSSVGLMGARCVIVGLRPAVAMALVSMDIDLAGIRTALNLEAALAAVGAL